MAEAYIGTNMRVLLCDGRQLDGVLTIVDPFGNLLLLSTWETSRDRLNGNLKRRRELGLVSVPRPQVERVAIDVKSAAALKAGRTAEVV